MSVFEMEQHSTYAMGASSPSDENYHQYLFVSANPHSGMHKSTMKPEPKMVETNEPPTNREKITGATSIRNLFVFTPPSHIPLLLGSILTAAAVAAAKTLYAVLLGRIFDLVARFGAGGIGPEDDFLGQVARWCLVLCLLGLGVCVFAGTDMAMWVASSELRARNARRDVFSALLHREMAWFDLREEGLSGLLTGIER
jgi:ATP-binding cassette subfamily B (MDR/TAP) protein 1